MRHLDNFLGRLTGVVREGAGWRACCPVHDDHTPDLHVSLGHENRILYYCPVCGNEGREKIIKLMGLHWRDLIAKGKDAFVRHVPQAQRVGSADSVPDADLDTRNKAYTYLASRTRLLPEHEEELTRRGLDRAHIHSDGYFSVEEVSQNCLGRLLIDLGEELYSIPGFSHNVRGKPRFAWDGRGLFIPVRDEQRRIVSGQIRTGGSPKYVWLRGSGSPRHVPLMVDIVPEGTVWVTEGPLKADVCAALAHIPIVGISGVSCWRGLMPWLKRQKVRRVVVAYDADWTEKKEVRKHMLAFEEALAKSGYDVDRGEWKPELGKGLDDLLASGLKPNIREIHRAGNKFDRADGQGGESKVFVLGGADCRNVRG